MRKALKHLAIAAFAAVALVTLPAMTTALAEPAESELTPGPTNDTFSHWQYQLEPIGDGTSNSGANLLAAWELLAARPERSTVTVAVLDTGVDMRHPDLAANIRLDLARNFVDDSTDVTDTLGHGTEVAGLIGATTGNTYGIAGSATGTNEPDGSGVKVLPIKIQDGTYDTIPVERFVRALDYLESLIDDGTLADLRVVNMSFRLPLTAEDANASEAHAAIKRLTAKGVLFVASGGNGTFESQSDPDPSVVADLHYPSDYDECLAVTALTSTGGNVGGYEYNRAKDVSAPGEMVYTTYPFMDDPDDPAPSEDPDAGFNDGYRYFGGTSCAAPIASSVAALMFRANPTLTPAQVMEGIEATAKPIPDQGFTPVENGSAGAVDAAAAIQWAIDRSAPTETVEVHRLYLPGKGSHLLTADANEMAVLADLGWVDEGVAGHSPAKGTVPVWRLYNPHTTEHLYTTDAHEYEALGSLGWNREGVAFYDGPDDGAEVHRLRNPFATGPDGHLFTTDANEWNALTHLGWLPEGIVWHAAS